MLSRVKLIAEPWDLGPGGYQLGDFPAGLGRVERPLSRHAPRASGAATTAQRRFAARLTGSSDLFDRQARRPWARVNFVAAHDGFTLADLVSYNDKHNEANGEDNSDGHDDNFSANCGVEGPTDDPDICDTRRARQRAMLATLLLRAGHADAARRRRVRPHAGRQQQRLLPGQRDLLARLAAGSIRRRAASCDALWRRLVALRQEHPVLRSRHFLHGRREPAPGSSTSPGSTRTAR